MSVNKSILIGVLGRDPEFKQVGSGLCTFSVATKEKWRDKQTGEQKEQTDWHNVETWGRLAEICSQYLRKGSKVYLEGAMKTDKFEKEGQTHYRTKVRATTMQMLGGKKQEAQTSAPALPEDPDFSDDIPF